MAAIIRIKRSTGTSAPGTLKTGELAYSAGTGLYNNGGDRLYFGKGDDGSGNATTVEVVGGAYFANLADHAPGTLTSSSAIITDASNKIDAINVDNITIDGNTISSTDTNGNVVISPDGSGVIDVSNTRIVNVNDPTSPQDAATKAYVDAQNTAQILSISGDTGSDTVDLDDSALAFAGDDWLTATVTNNTVTFTHDVSGVLSGTYGSQTAIPVITVDDRGHVDSIGTVAIATTLSFTGEAGSGSVSLLDSSLSFQAGEGIDITAANNTLTIAGELASDTNLGIASFNATDFTVSSGAVTANPIYLGTTRLDLGETDSDLAGLNSLEVGDIRITSNVISTQGTNNVLVIDPSPVGDSSGGFAGQLVVRGDLVVQGTTTTVNSTTVSINDKNLVLADSAADAAAADGGGITLNGANATITYDAGTDRWDFNKGLDIGGFTTLDSAVNIGGTGLAEVIEDHLANNYFLAGEGIDLTYNDGSNQLTVAAELATVTNPGVANFDSDQFTVTSGLVTVYQLDGGTY